MPVVQGHDDPDEQGTWRQGPLMDVAIRNSMIEAAPTKRPLPDFAPG